MLNWLFPSACAFCKKHIDAKAICCQYCLNSLPWHYNQDDEFILFNYEPPIVQDILNLKFHHQLNVSKIFGELFARSVQQNRQFGLPTRLIPVPLYRKRLQQRGFNQAIEIARVVARRCQIKLDIHSCMRIKHTKPQSALSASQRAANLENAFAVCRVISDKHVAVFDDVITTGQTVAALSAVLKKSGVERVEVWGVAKTKKNI